MINRIQILIFMLCLLAVSMLFVNYAQASDSMGVRTYSSQNININKKRNPSPALPPPFIEPAAGTMSVEEEMHVQDSISDLEVVSDTAPLEVILEDTSASIPDGMVGISISESEHSEKLSNHYILGPDDKIRVMVFGEQELSGEFKVTSDRTVSLPLIGVIDVDGKNLRETEQIIITKLKDGYLKDPNVSVEVIESRPFYIMGEVRAPGSYNYVNGMNILQAVAISGGFTYRANRKKINVLRGAGAPAEPVSMPPEERVKPGDIIFVKERFF